MLYFLFFVFFGHISIVLSQEIPGVHKGVCKLADTEILTCLTPCNDDPNNVTTICFERKIVEFFFKDERVYTDKTVGDAKVQWVKDNCKCLGSVDNSTVATMTGSTILNPKGGCQSNLNVYSCTNKFPQCTMENLKCRNKVPCNCRLNDLKPSTFPEATVVCVGNPIGSQPCDASAYIIELRSMNGEKPCTSCTFSSDKVLNACNDDHCAFDILIPTTMQLMLKLGYGKVKALYCPCDKK